MKTSEDDNLVYLVQYNCKCLQEGFDLMNRDITVLCAKIRCKSFKLTVQKNVVTGYVLMNDSQDRDLSFSPLLSSIIDFL